MRTVLSIVGAVLLIGLAVALLRWFDWDLGALIDWIWTSIWNLVMTVADFFSNNSFFQRAVSN